MNQRDLLRTDGAHGSLMSESLAARSLERLPNCTPARASWEEKMVFSDPDFVPPPPAPDQTSPERMVEVACEGTSIQARDLMTRHFELVEADVSVQKAADIMHRSRLEFLPICDEGRPVGEVTEWDLRALAETCRVGEVMNRDIQTCFQDEDLRDIASQMQKTHARRIAVVDRRGKLVGVVSLGDLSPPRAEDRLPP